MEAIETETISNMFLGPLSFWRATKLISDQKGKSSEEQLKVSTMLSLKKKRVLKEHNRFLPSI